MIDVVVQAVCWPKEDWEEMANSACSATALQSAFAALITSPTPAEITIRLTSDAEVQVLNRDYRGKDVPTNVLSFPMRDGGGLDELLAELSPSPLGAQADEPEILLGDIILAYETCAREAADKNVTLQAHAQHLIIHGTLHLLGYDHINDEDAAAMEALERQIMSDLGLHDPYDDENEMH